MPISALTAATNAAQTLGNLILVTPQAVVGYQPQDPNTVLNTGSPKYSAPALLFNYEGEQTSQIESDVTDHFVEDNTSVQDQIALKPVIVTTQGFVGELNDAPPNGFFRTAQVATQKLTGLAAYAPAVSVSALVAYNRAFQAYQTINNLRNSAVATWESVTGSGGTSVITGTNIRQQPNQTKQQRYYQQFYGYWTSRTLFTVQTPWAIFTDMAILRLRAVQSAESNLVTDFEVTFKQIRFAKTLSDTVQPQDAQGRLQQQASPVVNMGTSAVVPSQVTFSQALATVS